ncbi:RNA-binding S4 domain-containing protein [Altererythrobacter aerius]|uniref:RNA-binding S4 domain-containing protein n=1 Tax=Tsuneonella aeria TaxID=1837929 RepID=A0A6I4TDZ4_9SPHN|nr:RNA-binding S4 domain-containing protein [Tsuneonella aeria]
MRVDKLLWHLRLAKTRSVAQQIVAAGHVRRNGVRVLRCSADIHPGDTLTIPLAGGVRVIEIIDLPARRGPPAEAQACYRALDPQAGAGLAADTIHSPGRGQPQ